jgi:hypothetical protein
VNISIEFPEGVFPLEFDRLSDLFSSAIVSVPPLKKRTVSHDMLASECRHRNAGTENAGTDEDLLSEPATRILCTGNNGWAGIGVEDFRSNP